MLLTAIVAVGAVVIILSPIVIRLAAKHTSSDTIIALKKTSRTLRALKRF